MKKVILVIDDEQDVHVLIENLLDQNQYDVIKAIDGAEGFEVAQAMQPDLIILDVQMPKLDGFEVYKKLLNESNTRDIPVIMLTGIADKRGVHFDSEDMEAHFSKAPVAYIEKPLKPEAFTKLIEKTLD